MMATPSPTTSASSDGSDLSHYPEDPLLNHPIYSTVRCLGSGGQAFVLLAKNRLTKELVAIKCWPRGVQCSICQRYVEDRLDQIDKRESITRSGIDVCTGYKKGKVHIAAGGSSRSFLQQL
jgi:hypothetical protein